MLVQMDARGILSAAFKQMRKFLLVFGLVLAAGIAYIVLAEREYESTAQLLVKFGQDARPEISQDARASLSADEKRGIVNANVSILTSRDLGAKLLQDLGVDKVYPKLAQNPPARMPLEDAALKKLSKDLTTKVDPDAGTIEVSLYNGDAQMAAGELKHLIDLFQQQQAQVYSNPQTDVLKEQAQTAAHDLDAANKKLYDYKSNTGITALDEELSLLLKQRGDLAGYLSRRQTGDTPAAESASSTSTALPARVPVPGDTARFPVMEDIQKRIDDLRAKEADLLQTYKPDSPVIRNLRRNIATETAALNASVGALNGQIQSLDQQIAEKHKLKAELDDLTRQVQYAEEAYKSAQERLHTAEINNDLNERKITRISVIEQPSVPYKATRPNKPLALALTLLIGLALGAAVAMLAEIMDRTFASPEQMSATLGLPALATLKRRREKNVAFTPDELGALYQSLASVLGTAANNNGEGRVVCLTSCYKGEGNTTVAAELARFIADKIGGRILLVTEKALPTGGKSPARLSLNELGEDATRLDQAIAPLPAKMGTLAVAHLQPAGEMGLLKIDALRRLMAQMKRSFDLILVVAPGMLATPAKTGLSQLADGTVFVVEAARTRAPAAQQAVQNLRQTGARILGGVLTKQNHYIPGWLYKSL